MKKLELVENHIQSKKYMLKTLETLIKNEQESVNYYIEKGDYKWVKNSSDKLSDYCSEHYELSKLISEFESLLDFLKEEENK